MHRPRPIHRPAAFTLVELACVIAVLTVLAVLTVPVVQSQMRQARGVTCLSNVRQLVQATLLYANENGSLLPPSTGENQAFGILYREGYVEDPSIFVCPINAAEGKPLGTKILGGKYDCYYSAPYKVVTYWGDSGFKVLERPTRLFDADALSAPIVFDQRANKADSFNKHRPADGTPGGVFGYLDGSVRYVISPESMLQGPIQ